MAPPRRAPVSVATVDVGVLTEMASQIGNLAGAVEQMTERMGDMAGAQRDLATAQAQLTRDNAEQHAETAEQLGDIKARLKALEAKRPDKPGVGTWLKDHWQILFGIGSVLAGILAAMFGVKGGEQ